MAENKEQETKQVASIEAPVETKPTAAKTVEVAASKDQTPQSNPRQNNNNNNNNNNGNNRNAQGNRNPNNRRNNNGRRNQRGRNQRRPQEFEERVVDIARVTNVVKGGRRFSFSTLVVIGDKKGRVAYGHGKAKEVPDSIKKAIKDARRNLIKTPIVDKRTIPHITQAKFISSNVLLKPAPKGKGIIASGAVRAVVELAGYHDIVTKSLGSSNKANTVKATIEALKLLKTTKEIASLRNKDESHFK